MARVNFVDIEDQKSFEPIPRGTYTLEITDVTDRYAGEDAKNPGARMLNWELSVPEGEEYAGRKVWDQQVCVQKSMWRVKGLMSATGKVDVSKLSYDDEEQEFYLEDEDGDDVVFDVTDLIGSKVDAKVKIQAATRERDASNAIGQFMARDEDDDLE